MVQRLEEQFNAASKEIRGFIAFTSQPKIRPNMIDPRARRMMYFLFVGAVCGSIVTIYLWWYQPQGPQLQTKASKRSAVPSKPKQSDHTAAAKPAINPMRPSESSLLYRGFQASSPDRFEIR